MPERESHHDAQPVNGVPASPQLRAGELGSPIVVEGRSTRRLFLTLLGGAFLAGCASPQHAKVLPEPDWPAAPRPDLSKPVPVPVRPPARPQIEPAPVPLPAGVIPRSQWAKGAPDYSDMDRMPRITHITIHHDALTPLVSSEAGASRARLELIRCAHRGKRWSDIGYHYIVDRAGRVYEGRPITWQGAHVKDRNEGNIGVLCMGNFEVQSPSEQQMKALTVHVRALRTRHGVPAKNVLTHREWPGAKTLCPGGNLQRRVVVLRNQKAWV